MIVIIFFIGFKIIDIFLNGAISSYHHGATTEVKTNRSPIVFDNNCEWWKSYDRKINEGKFISTSIKNDANCQ